MTRFLLEDDSAVEGAFIGTEKATGRLTIDNRSDVYQVHLENPGNLRLNLTGLTADVDFELIADANSNGQFDSGDTVIGTGSLNSSPTQEIVRDSLQSGDYLIQCSRLPTSAEDPDFFSNRIVGETDYQLTAYTDGYYYFTHYYGDGEYYKGLGRISPNESSLRAGQVIREGSPNESGLFGYTVIDMVANSPNSSERGKVKVYQYYDANFINADGTRGALADSDKSGGDIGHLHPYPYDASTDPNYQTIYMGLGKQGLGSEAGLIHPDGHPFGFPVNGDAMFSNYYEADMHMPHGM